MVALSGEGMHQACAFPLNSARNLICAVADRVRAADLCEAANLDPALIRTPSAQITFKQLTDLYESAARLTNDPFLGLRLGSQTDARLLGMYYYLVRNSPTFGEALRRATQYNSLWTDGLAKQLQIEKSTACLIREYLDPSVSESRHYCELVSLMCFRFGQLIVGSHLKVREVHFQHHSPKDVSEHRRMFRAPVHFGMPANELIYDKAVLQLALKDADVALGEVLIQQADHLLRRTPEQETLTGRAEAALYRALQHGRADLATVCRSLGMSLRSLQRALKNEGISYRGLLSNVRRKLAEQYLGDPGKSVSEIAYLLGYSDPSKFHRAFHVWTGMPPGQYRRMIMRTGPLGG